jgi:hypothetical protein
MALGMSPREFWDADPLLVIPYRAKYRQKLEYDNFVAYLHGLYAYEAFGAVQSTVNRKKGARATPYVKEPHKINAASPLEMEVKRLSDEAAERQRMIDLRDNYDNDRENMDFGDMLEAEQLWGSEKTD